MSSEFEHQLEESLAMYQRRRQELEQFQRDMADIAVTVVSPRRVVSVTTGSTGEITDIKFPSAAYKNSSPAELSAILLKTIADARSAALDKAAVLLSPMLPAGMDAAQIMRGKADLAAMMPESVEDMRAMFGNEPFAQG